MEIHFDVINVLVILILYGILGVIQVLLCRFKSGIPGMILPLVILFPGILISLTMPDFAFIFPLLLFLLPEIILITIYLYIRRKPKTPTSDELRNMRAQDL